MVNSTTTYDALPGLRFDTSFGKLPEHFFSKVSPTRVKQPKLVKLNDALARELGLDVPNDVSITGFDDIELARIVTPPLTTVHVPHRTMGRTAADALIDMVEKRREAISIELPITFEMRGSLAPPRA